MKNLIFIIVSVVISINSYAQDIKFQNLIENNQWEDLSSYTTTLINSGDNSYSNFYWQYISYQKMNNITKAINSLQNALKYHNDRPAIMSNLADIYFKENRYLESKNVLDSILKKQEQTSRDIKQRCLIFEFYKNSSSALRLLVEHSKQDSLNPFYHIHLADNYRFKKKKNKAIYHYNKALKLRPNNLKTSLKLINIYLNQDPIKAIGLCKTVIKKDSSNIRFVQKMAIAYIKLDSNKRALSLYKRCINMGDSSQLTLKNAGMLMQKAGENKRATILLESAYKIDSTNVNVSYYLALALSKISEYKKSLKYFDKTLSLLIPDDSVMANIYYEEGVMYRKMGHNIEAFELLSKADKYIYNDYRILYMLAETYSRLHYNIDDVVEKYEKFLNAAKQVSLKSKGLKKKIEYVNYKIKSLKEMKFMRSKK